MTTTIAEKIASLKEGDRVRVEYTGEGENPAKVTVEGTVGYFDGGRFGISVLNIWRFSVSGFDEESYITNLEILDPPEPANLSVVIGKEDEVAYQRLDVCAAGIRRWFKAGHFIAYSWREIAHKVRVVKV